jgi:hypothetical protein
MGLVEVATYARTGFSGDVLGCPSCRCKGVVIITNFQWNNYLYLDAQKELARQKKAAESPSKISRQKRPANKPWSVKEAKKEKKEERQQKKKSIKEKIRRQREEENEKDFDELAEDWKELRMERKLMKNKSQFKME